MEKSAKMNLATVVAYGEALWDLLPSGPVLGGAPLNFAYRINSLGYRGVMISQLGSDSFGDQALEQMTALGMDTAFIQRTSEYPTGTVEVILDENKNPDYNIIHRRSIRSHPVYPRIRDVNFRRRLCMFRDFSSKNLGIPANIITITRSIFREICAL